jgi:TRAP-type C4-dicarboxylate transport system permease small subunit
MKVMETVRPSLPPRWYGIPVRVALLTFLGTLISFSVSLLLAIVGTVVAAAARGVHPDLRIAYRYIALPVALVAGGMIFIGALVMEIRHYRQAKTLTAIERVSQT